MAVRWVIVDDTDPRIEYVGPWYNGSSQTNDFGDFGPLFQGTVHGVDSQHLANISYMFTGSRIRAFGTTDILENEFFLWECFVDNTSISSKPPTDNSESGRILCDSDSLADGTHNFTLQTRMVYQGNTFWLDQIQYVPSVGLSLDSSLILVNASDSAIQYTAGWQDTGLIVAWNMSYYTTLPNRQADMTFDFNGTSLKWFSLTLNDTALTSNSSSSYTIDEADPVSFGLEPAASGLVRYNRLVFEVSNLSPGQHRLSVSHVGYDQANSLTLNYLMIQNPPALSGLPSSSSPSNPGGFTPSSPATENHKGYSTGAIVGGAMGGVVVITAVVLLLFLCRQRRRKDLDQEPNREETSPNFIEPFNTPLTAPVSFQKSYSGGQSSSSAVSTGLTRHVPHHPSKFHMIPSGPRLLTSRNLSNESSGSPENYNSTPGNTRPQEADELREQPSMNLLSVPPEIPGTSTSYSPSDTAAPQRVMRHENSGVRLPTQESMLELPPLYTAL